MNLIRRLVPHKAEWVLYRADSLPPADVSDLKVDVIGPGQGLNREQKAFLCRHIPALRLWRFLRFHRRKQGWIVLAASGGVFCHYSFVTPARVYRGMFPGMGSQGQMIGPCLTEEAFRGRAIYRRILQYIVNLLSPQGLAPFYVFTQPNNPASMRGVENAGFARCGLWSGRRYFLDLRVVSRRLSD